MKNVEINKQAKLSQHFTLGELCKTSVKTKDGNIPSHVAIENLKRVCGWLEMLRARVNPLPTSPRGGEVPIIINSGYRSPAVNKAVGGVATSNHLTGCAVDIRVLGMEQLLRYCSHPAGHQRRVARGLRRVADGAQRQGHLLAALCSEARRQQAENKADCLLTEVSDDTVLL